MNDLPIEDFKKKLKEHEDYLDKTGTQLENFANSTERDATEFRLRGRQYRLNALIAVKTFENTELAAETAQKNSRTATKQGWISILVAFLTLIVLCVSTISSCSKDNNFEKRILTLENNVSHVNMKLKTKGEKDE